MGNRVFIATSLDGYIARQDESIDWLIELPNPENSDYGFSAFLEGADAILMGRKSFEVVLGFKQWPYSKPLPVFVLSDSLQALPQNLPVEVEIVRGKLKEIIETLDARGFHNLYIDGGKTIQGFLRDDLIDEMIITKVPILLGSGIPLFGKMDVELTFDHVETKVFNNMLVRSKYARNR